MSEEIIPTSSATSAVVRETREVDTRALSERLKQWEAPGQLPNPNPRPGIRFKWVRRALMGDTDKSNMFKALRAGWVAVNPSDVPELAYLLQTGNGVTPASTEGAIEYGGLILMAMSEESARKRAQHYNNIQQNQERAIDTQLHDAVNHPLMPLEKKVNSKVSVGRKGQANTSG